MSSISEGEHNAKMTIEIAKQMLKKKREKYLSEDIMAPSAVV